MPMTGGTALPPSRACGVTDAGQIPLAHRSTTSGAEWPGSLEGSDDRHSVSATPPAATAQLAESGVANAPTNLGVAGQDSLLAEIRILRQLILSVHGDVLQNGRSTCVAELYATLLGSFDLYRAHSRLAIAVGRPALTLLEYLIVHVGRQVPREELAELLWPDQDALATVHRLHVAVSKLRGVVDRPGARESILRCDGNSYSISAGTVVLDCRLFDRQYQEGRSYVARGERRQAAAAFRAALELYTGDFLNDEPYAAWTEPHRVHFAERRLDALGFLCDAALGEGDLPAVLDYARQIVATDCLRERAHRQLMRAHYGLGQRGCAVRQYHTCQQLLARELGVQPSRETQALYDAICHDAELPIENLFVA